MARIRNKLLQCWVTAAEKKAVGKMSRENHSSVSNFIRMAVLNGHTSRSGGKRTVKP